MIEDQKWASKVEKCQWIWATDAQNLLLRFLLQIQQCSEPEQVYFLPNIQILVIISDSRSKVKTMENESNLMERHSSQLIPSIHSTKWESKKKLSGAMTVKIYIYKKLLINFTTQNQPNISDLQDADFKLLIKTEYRNSSKIILLKVIENHSRTSIL